MSRGLVIVAFLAVLLILVLVVSGLLIAKYPEQAATLCAATALIVFIYLGVLRWALGRIRDRAVR